MDKKFTKNLINWHLTENTRKMPWKDQNDPYKIWISEIILQQTRVSQGTTYYNNFIKKFPTIKSLAKAKDEVVFKLWEGLGYYSRCKNILHTARYIQNNLGGHFPASYDQIILLKGVGPYTAAAIASFAFGLPHAVLDGNVFRVLARYFGEFIPIDSTEGKKIFTQKANLLLDKKIPAAYNQAIMDFGAQICKPQPACNECPLQADCKAFKNNWIKSLPVKKKLPQKKNRWFYYFVFSIGEKYLLQKRISKDIWQNLHEFYLVEMPYEIKWTRKKINEMLKENLKISATKTILISPTYMQTLTHQKLSGQFITIELSELPESLKQMQLYSAKEISKIALPKFINNFIGSPHFH